MVIDIIEKLLGQKRKAIDDWFVCQFEQHKPFFYNSVDLRHSGFKLAPVDNNIFPAGFNNLNDEAIELTISQVKLFLANYFPDAKNILLIPESHTRNLKYLDNIRKLMAIIRSANVEIKLGSFDAEMLSEKDNIVDSNGDKIELLAIKKIKKDSNYYIETDDGFLPDLIIVNNDFTIGSPEILQNIQQSVVPSTGMGWYRRRKHIHFAAYNKIAEEFCKEFDLDKFYITTEFDYAKNVNFKEKSGIEEVASKSEILLNKIATQYKEKGINDKPYLYIKADNGTYGMGIMTIESADELFEINKKTRNKMSVIKNNTINMEVIIQEGVKTIDKVNNYPAEPFIYLVNGSPIGTIFRINSERDDLANLNSAGVSFKNIADSHLGFDPFVYGLVAKLSALASAMEVY